MRRVVAVYSILSLSMFFATLLVASIPGLANATTVRSLVPDAEGTMRRLNWSITMNAGPFLKGMINAAEALTSYSFQFEIRSGTKGDPEEEGTLYFKKPGHMRIEENGRFRHGAVAVVDPNGKIRGHLGGILSSVIMTLKPDSDLLRSTNGWPMVRSDYVSIVRALEEFSQQGHEVHVSDTPETAEDCSEKVYIMDISVVHNPDKLYKRVYIDPISMLPVALLDYKNGRVWARSIWKNVSTTVVMSDGLFEM